MSDVLAARLSSAKAIKDAKAQLGASVLSGELPASEYPARYAKLVDDWLAVLLDEATNGKTRGYALVAVGGYGRSELSPASDLDLVLIHRNRRHYEQVAEKIWYTIWDTSIHLDHSVRSRSEVLSM